MSEARTAAEIRREYGVPEAIRLRADEGCVVAFTDGAESAAERVAAHPDDLPQGDVPLMGRGPLAVLPSPLGPLVARECRKGGLLRRVRGRRFRGRFRPLDELVLLRRLAGCGVPVAEGVGAVVLLEPKGWRGFLLTKQLVGAVDLERYLYGEAPSAGGARDVLRDAGRAVRLLHDAGVRHADLHPKNLLIDMEGGPGAPPAPKASAGRVVVIDLDRATAFEGSLPHDQRLKNLARLARSVEKHRLRGMVVSRRHALRFLAGYAGDAEAAALWLDEIRARLKADLPMRILWWRWTGQAKPRERPAPSGVGAA